MNTTNTKKITTTIVFSTLLFVVLATAIKAAVYSQQLNGNELSDAYIGDESPTATEGNGQVIALGYYPVVGVYKQFRSLIEFNTTQIELNLTNTSITNVTLDFYITSTQGQGCNFRTLSHKILQTWDESIVSWNNRNTSIPWNTPGLDNVSDYNASIGSVTICNQATGGHCIIEITQPFIDQINDMESPGILLRVESRNQTSANYCLLGSSDHNDPNKRPILNITYTIPLILTEAEAQPVILQAINNIVPNATPYNYQQAYLVDACGNQTYATWHYYVLYNSKRWAINYVTGNEQFVQAANLTPSVYVLETANLTATTLRIQVETFLNTTLNP